MTRCEQLFLKCLLSTIIGIAGVQSATADDTGSSNDAPRAAQAEAGPKPAYIRLEPKIDNEQSRAEPSPEKPHETPPAAKPIDEQPTPGRSLKLSGGVEEKNLAIDWDDWHNAFGHAVASGMFENFGDALNMEHGLTTWYHCSIDADRHVKHAEITKSSGNLWYDREVLEGVYKLNGSYILAFPPGSQRSEIAADFGIRMGGAKTGYLRFGDVEYHEVSTTPTTSPNSIVENKEIVPSRHRRRKDRE